MKGKGGSLFLNDTVRLTGTKLGCGEGGCGACTVMLSKFDPKAKTVRHFTANSCLVPLCAVHGMAVITVEGIGSIKSGLHPVQKRLAESHGTQCGFCTPGIVMSMYTLLRNKSEPSMKDIKRCLEGNLCRCTGYRPILEGFKPFAENNCTLGEKCCRNTKEVVQNELTELSGFPNGYLPQDSTQDPIFPPLLRTNIYAKEHLVFNGERTTWIRPTSIEELLHLKTIHQGAKIVIGNTEIGIEMKNVLYPVLIAATHIQELNAISIEADGMHVGASVTLVHLEETLREVIESNPDYRTRVFQALLEILRWFGGQQIRNVASVAGNIMTASPISDLNPLLMAAGVELKVQSLDQGRRTVLLDEHFFISYRETAVRPNEILVSLKLPYTSKNDYIQGYKQAHRREDGIAIVNAGMHVLFEDDSDVVKDITIAFGGMAPTTVMPVKTIKAIIGSQWNDALVNKVTDLLADDLFLSPGAPGGMVDYRRTLAISFFFKFFLSVQMQLPNTACHLDKVPHSYRSSILILDKQDIKSSQTYEESVLGGDSVGLAIPHISAYKQVTGETIYVDDIPRYQDELYLAFVYSEKANARLVSVEVSEIFKLPGVVDYISEKDLHGPNVWSSVDENEIHFATDKVTCVGQIIGAVVADTKEHAKLAARAVKVQYDELPHIITIKDAIAAESYFCHKKLEVGNVGRGMELSDHVLEGEVHVGGQEHFYLETHAALAVPKNEDGEMEMFVSTQNANLTQMMVASALGIQCNKVVVRVKRLGGGFGGKETRNIMFAIPLALAANKLQKPVRFMLDRDEDMVCSGTRHPFFGKYKVGFTQTGKIVALDIDLYNNAGNTLDFSDAVGFTQTGKIVALDIDHYNNAGNTLDFSDAVMMKGMMNCANSYNISNVNVRGHVCKTNITSNTACRGFGSPQTMFICETFVTDIAYYLNMSQTQVRYINLYVEGDRTLYNQSLDGCNIRRCWSECLDSSHFTERRIKIEQFNRNNRWKKRGIAIVPTTYGIALEFPYLNQAGCLVVIYRDGSVLLTHGGTEMGQGLHTKMIQVASRALNVPLSKIHISETSTNTVPNASSTSGSVSSDLYGMAVLNACTELRERLEPFITEKPKGKWEEWVNSAYLDRVSLSATGFYKTPGLNYNFETNSGRCADYFSFGVGCSEVEIDCLTGEHQVLRTDIVMDVGQSLNPAIDIGQIEGAFIQGYGLLMMEQQKMSQDGYLRTRGPGSYKIPSIGDIPAEFKVSLLKGSHNKRAVYSSKAIGEPPLFLSASVFFAVKDAIQFARKEEGIDENFQLDSPATPERIRMACQDRFTDKFSTPDSDSFKPWFVTL